MLYIMSDLEIELADRTVILNERVLRRIQAFWRGTLVRKQVMLLRNEYERVLKEIEGPECSLQLTWQYDLFSRPEIAKSGKPGLSVIRIDKPTCALTQDEVSPEISSEISDHPSHKQLKDDVCDNGIKISDQNTEPERDNSEGEYLANTKPSKDCPSEPPTSISPPTISEENFEGVGSQLAENINNNTSNDDGNLGPADFESLQPHTQVWDTMDMDSSQAQPKGCNPLNVDRESLLKERDVISMELLWIQQAIDSRKQYLRLRQEMAGGST